MSGRDMCYALPELQQWESARTDQYVWGDPAAIEAYGKGLDTAGGDLTAIAESLGRMNVADFWTGPAATAFTELKGRVTPAVKGLADMNSDAGAALGTWQRHLGVYQEDCGSAITTGKQGWRLYQTTSCDNTEARNKMNTGKTGIGNAQTSSMTSGRTCKSELEAAAAKADVPTAPPAPARPTGPTAPISTTPGQVGKAPSGQEPVPAPVPYAPGWYVDPANGQLVRPVPGPWAIGQQPWEYVNGPSPFTAQQFTTQPGTLGLSPSGQAPVPLTGPIVGGQERPYVDPSNGRVVVPVQGPYANGQRPWVYQD